MNLFIFIKNEFINFYMFKFYLEFPVEYAPGGGRTSGSKDGRHFWYEIHIDDAQSLEDQRCCRKISP